MAHQNGRAEGPIMREPTRGNGPRGTIRIIETLAVFDPVVPPATDRGRSMSSAEGPRPAQQNDETNPAHVPEMVVGPLWPPRGRQGVHPAEAGPKPPADPACGAGPAPARHPGRGRLPDANHLFGYMSHEANGNLDKICRLCQIMLPRW